MRLHEDDSHIVADQELKEELLDSALDDANNDVLIEEAILSALRNDGDTLVYIFNEIRSIGEIEDRFIDELIQCEIDKRKEI